MKVPTVLLLTLVLVVILAVGCATVQGPASERERAAPQTSARASLPGNVPLPDDLNVIPPDPGVDPALARFSGIWQGTWLISRGDTIAHVLVVEEVGRNGARVIYAWGQFFYFSYGFVGQPGWGRYMAAFVDGALKMAFPRLNAVITYRMNEDGTISARREEPGLVSTATLVKVR